MDSEKSDDSLNLLNIMGLGEFSGKKNYYHEMEREKIEFERIFSEAINGILQIEFTGEIIVCNPAFWKMCGYTDFRDLTVCCNSFDKDILKVKNDFIYIVETLKKSERIIGYETQIIKADNTPLHISLDGHIQVDRGRQIIEFFIQNIDKRKKAEQEIEASQLFTNNILDASALLSIISTDLEGTITIFNRGAEIMLGYDASELEGKFSPAVFHSEEEVISRGKELSQIYGEDITGFEVFVKKARLEGSEEREWTYIKKNRERITVNLVVTAIHDKNENIIGFLGIAKDITQEKRVQKELIEAKSMVSSIIDSMPSFIIGVDSFLSVTQWNKQIEYQTGIVAKDAIGKSPFELYKPLLDFEEDIIQSVDADKVLIKSKIKVFENNETRYKDLTVFPLINEGFRGGVIRLDDVTESVKLEALIVQSEKMLSVGGLAAGMAHEINNPLAGIIQGVQNIQRRLFSNIQKNLDVAESLGLDYENVKKYLVKRDIDKMLNRISESGLRASKIVKNMLSFSRKSNDDFVEVSIKALINNTISLAETDFSLKSDFDFKSIEIIKNFEDSLPHVLCEPSKIQQVIYNLIKNGTEAMRGKESPKFIFTVHCDKKWIIIEIEDNGHGMSEVVRKRIFEPFFTTKDVGKGTGLGMSVSYFIICDLHHGELSVDSEVGEKTKFCIKLPR